MQGGINSSGRRKPPGHRGRVAGTSVLQSALPEKGHDRLFRDPNWLHIATESMPTDRLRRELDQPQTKILVGTQQCRI